jgi:hypothetical protein
MKIVDYDTFVSLPEKTLYSFYAPCYTDGLKVKGETTNKGKDWFYSDMLDNPKQEYEGEFLQYAEVMEKMEKGESIKADFHILERDGMFDYERQFLVYEKEDIEEMIEKLKELL